MVRFKNSWIYREGHEVFMLHRRILYLLDGKKKRFFNDSFKFKYFKIFKKNLYFSLLDLKKIITDFSRSSTWHCHVGNVVLMFMVTYHEWSRTIVSQPSGIQRKTVEKLITWWHIFKIPLRLFSPLSFLFLIANLKDHDRQCGIVTHYCPELQF